MWPDKKTRRDSCSVFRSSSPPSALYILCKSPKLARAIIKRPIKQFGPRTYGENGSDAPHPTPLDPAQRATNLRPAIRAERVNEERMRMWEVLVRAVTLQNCIWERERARDSSRDWMQIESKLFLFGRRGTFQLCSPRAFFHYKLFLLHKLRRTKWPREIPFCYRVLQLFFFYY